MSLALHLLPPRPPPLTAQRLSAVASLAIYRHLQVVSFDSPQLWTEGTLDISS